MSGKAILVVEDGMAERRLLRTVLEDCDIESGLRMTANGLQAMDYLKGRAPYNDRSVHPFPELVLLDLFMPVMNGFEVLECIRKTSALAPLPVVVFSSSAGEDNVGAAYEAGADVYLRKPVDYEGLLEVLKGLDRVLAGDACDFQALRSLPEYRDSPFAGGLHSGKDEFPDSAAGVRSVGRRWIS